MRWQEQDHVGASSALVKELRIYSERKGKSQKGYCQGGMNCSALWGMGWQKEGVGDGETESYRRSLNWLSFTQVSSGRTGQVLT